MAQIRFGVSARDITPPYPVMLHGYSARNRLSGIRPEDAVEEPISARVLALEGSDGTGGRSRLLIVCLDMIGVQTPEVQLLRREISRATGVAPQQILIAATHTHFAPSISISLFTPPELGIVDPDPRFVARVTRAVVEAASESIAEMAGGVLETYRAQVPSVLFNRRTILRSSGAERRVETNFMYPEHPELYDFSPVDPELTALRVWGASGPAVCLLNFGCHPVTGGEDGEGSYYRISADYPYHARAVIEHSWRCPVLFTLGAAGDAVPMNRRGGSRAQIGAALGNAVLLGERSFAAAGRLAENDAVVASRIVEMEVKTIIPAGSAGAERLYAGAREKLLALSGRDPEETAVRDATRLWSESAIRAFRARLYPEDRYAIQAQLLRIGSTVLVALPFEVLAEVGLRLKRSFPETVLVSVANGYEGYLPFAYEYGRGGYEASAESTHFEVGTADRLVERLLEELRSF
jgi:neutral ceramidase